MPDALFPRGAPLLGAMLLAFLAGGCVHYDHAYYAPRVQHGVAYASHHYHDDVLLVFDSGYGCYLVDGYAEHYFFDDHFYRYDHGRWQRSAQIHGPWHPAIVNEVPHGIQGSHAQRRSGKAQRPAQREAGAPRAVSRVQPVAPRGRTQRAIAPKPRDARPPRREFAQDRREVRTGPRRVRSERRGTSTERREARPARRELGPKRDAAAVEPRKPRKPRRTAQRGGRGPVAPEAQLVDRKPRKR